MNKQTIDILSNVAIGVGGVIFGVSLFFKQRGKEVEIIEEIEIDKIIEETHNIKRTGTGGFNDELADIEDGLNNIKHQFKEFSSLDMDGDHVPRIYTEYAQTSTHERESEPEEPKRYILPEKKSIVIISEDAYFENDWEWDQDVLHYYADDDVLTDERDEVLSNKEYYVGDEALDYFFDDDVNAVYIVHYGEKKLFEIALEPGSYSESVLGLDPEVFEKIGGYDKNIEKEE